MNVPATIPVVVQIRRSRLLGLIAVVAALAAVVTWAVLAVAFPGDGGGSASRSTSTPSLAPEHAVAVEWARGYGNSGFRFTTSTHASSLTPDQRVAVQWGRGFAALGRARVVQGGPTAIALRDPSIMSRTPAQLAAGPALESVLASMSPQTRRYTKAIMNLTFAQLAAGAAGHP